jgi:hypothetical protein
LESKPTIKCNYITRKPRPVDGELHSPSKIGRVSYLSRGAISLGKESSFRGDYRPPLTGTTNWTTEETPFFLKKGENPDIVKLNLVINGKGTAWIDDIRLLKAPLQ